MNVITHSKSFQEHGHFYLNNPPDLTADEWCEGKIAPEGKCFQGTMSNSVDERCKCEDQMCHLPLLEKLEKDKSKKKKKEDNNPKTVQSNEIHQ
jgi:hypothetical protein